MTQILFFGLQYFEGKTLGNAVDMSKSLAKKGHKTYFLNPFPGFSVKAFFNAFFKPRINQKNIDGVLVLSANYYSLISDSKTYIRIPFIHKWLSRKLWRPVLRNINENKTDFIIDNEFVKSFYLPEITKNKVLYYMRDYLAGVAYWESIAKHYEGKFIAKCSGVLTNSPYYSNYALKFRANSVQYIGQGVDVDALLFSETTLPSEYLSLKKPIALYIGLISTTRLDLQLLEKVCSVMDFDFVFIGPEDNDFKSSTLHKTENVHFLGKKDFTELAAYIQHSTVCFNPQKLNPITIGNYPRKVDEYMAFGKPVVHLKTEGITMFEPLIITYNDEESIFSAFQLALDRSTDNAFCEASKQLALSHSWNHVAKKIEIALGYEH